MKNHLLYPYRHGLIALWLLAFAFYHLAWTVHETAFATQNGFDLAEQVSLHPAIRAESPALRTSGFLRLPIPMMALGLAFTALLCEDSRWKWFWRAMAFLIALRVNPPEAALRALGILRDNDNAFQLAYLTVLGVGLVLATLPLEKLFQRFLSPLLVGVVLLGTILPALGLNRAIQLWHELQLDVSLGGGSVLYLFTLVIVGGLLVWRWGFKTNDPIQHGVSVTAQQV